jgi:hypothetical protein
LLADLFAGLLHEYFDFLVTHGVGQGFFADRGEDLIERNRLRRNRGAVRYILLGELAEIAFQGKTG